MSAQKTNFILEGTFHDRLFSEYEPVALAHQGSLEQKDPGGLQRRICNELQCLDILSVPYRANLNLQTHILLISDQCFIK